MASPRLLLARVTSQTRVSRVTQTKWSWCSSCCPQSRSVVWGQGAQQVQPAAGAGAVLVQGCGVGPVAHAARQQSCCVVAGIVAVQLQ